MARWEPQPGPPDLPELAPDSSWVRMENLGPALPTRREVALGILCLVLAAALGCLVIVLVLR